MSLLDPEKCNTLSGTIPPNRPGHPFIAGLGDGRIASCGGQDRCPTMPRGLRDTQ